MGLRSLRPAGIAATLTLVTGCAATEVIERPENARRDADALLVVDCLLPPRVRQLGQRLTYLEPRRPIRTSASECEIRGGEYTAYDRASFATALRTWLPAAQEGDPEAQTYVGEIYEKGLGVAADYALAASWYRRAAARNHARAKINLGYLHETGLGVARDLVAAMNYYRDASGLTDGDLEYVSSLEYAEREAARERSRELAVRVTSLEEELATAEARYREQRERVAESEAALATLRESVERQRERLADAAVADTASGGTGVPVPDAETARAAAAEGEELRAALAAQELRIREREAEERRLRSRIVELERAASASATERERLAGELTRAADALRRASGALEQARDEQRRLTARLRDAELEARERELQDRAIIVGLEAALDDRRRELDRQLADTGRLERELEETRAALAAAPDAAERARLRTDLDARTRALESARDEQRRLTARLRDAELELRATRGEAERELAVLEARLAERERELTEQQERLRALEGDLTGMTLARRERPQIESVAQVVATGPSIDIIDPPLLLARGTPALAVADAAFELVGRVTPADDLLAFRIDGEEQALDPGGEFRYRGAVERDDGRTMELLAVDNAGESARLSLQVVRRAAAAPRDPADAAATTPGAEIAGIDFGRYHALVIGNDDYRGLEDLETAADDAREVERVLRERYGYATTLLTDATRVDILAALDRLRRELDERDNLLIYYAGHGAIDPEDGGGYWLPVDADATDPDAWIANAALTGLADAIPAKHVLIIADSCYSGTMTPSSVARPLPEMTPELRRRWLGAVSASRVRAALSSGGLRPVIDGAPGARHSIFAAAFLERLRRNDDVLEAYALFLDVQREVARVARGLGLEQRPRYAPIRHAGHEAGEFLFVPQAALGRASPPHRDVAPPRRAAATPSPERSRAAL